MKYHIVFRIFEDAESNVCKEAYQALMRWQSQEQKNHCFIGFIETALKDLEAGERPRPWGLIRAKEWEQLAKNIGIALSNDEREELLHGHSASNRDLDIEIEILIPPDQEDLDGFSEARIRDESLDRLLAQLPTHFIERRVSVEALEEDYPDEPLAE